MPDVQALKRDLVTHNHFASRIYDIFVSHKPMDDTIKRASKTGTSVLRHVLTARRHTQPHSTPVTQPLKAVAIQCEAGDDFTVRMHSACSYIFALPTYIYSLICTNLVLKWSKAHVWGIAEKTQLQCYYY